MTPQESMVFAYGGHLCGWLLVAGYAAFRKRRCRSRAEVAAKAYDPTQLIQPGPACVHGTLEASKHEGADALLAVDLQERQHSGAWTEESRRVSAVPFYILTEQGERLRVEVDGGVRLNGIKFETEVLDAGLRRRHAEIRPGQAVYLEGEIRAGLDPEKLGGAYRDEPAPGNVLCAPTGGVLQLTEGSLGKESLNEARGYRQLQWLALILLVLNQLSLVPYHVRMLAAKTELVTVVGHDQHVTTHKGRATNNYEFIVKPSNRKAFKEAVVGDDFHLPVGTKLYHQDVSFWRELNHLGIAPMAGVWTAGIFLFLFIGLVGVESYNLLSGRRRRRKDDKTLTIFPGDAA